jgi:hypothetical protein
MDGHLASIEVSSSSNTRHIVFNTLDIPVPMNYLSVYLKRQFRLRP